MKTEKIMCSAIWVKDKNVTYVHYPTNITYGLVICGYRHCNCIEHLGNLYERERIVQLGIIQGFLTNNNRFVDRVEAKKIAESCGQMLHTSRKSELYSEDVWLIGYEGEQYEQI